MFEIWAVFFAWCYNRRLCKNKMHGCQADLKTQLVFAGCVIESIHLWIRLFCLNRAGKVPQGFLRMLLPSKQNKTTDHITLTMTVLIWIYISYNNKPKQTVYYILFPEVINASCHVYRNLSEKKIPGGLVPHVLCNDTALSVLLPYPLMIH